HNMQVSHETIYQYIYVQTKGELKKELISYLRHRKSKRQSRKLVHENRTTRFLLIVRLQGKDAESVRKAFAKAMKQLPKSLTLSLTYDRGKEMAEHKKFTMDTKIKVYFCDPHSPWQRGTNENTNGLVKDFWPKGTDFSKIPTKQIV
ncbi:MAG: IS30 family transposase, partial [Bacteroidota bacterium]